MANTRQDSPADCGYPGKAQGARARFSHGLSTWEWRFRHFEPFARAAAKRIEDLVDSQEISVDEQETKGGDREFLLYDQPEYRPAKDLKALGISGSIRHRINADMKRYHRDLPRLLDYVYFRTAPMAFQLLQKDGDWRCSSNCYEASTEGLKGKGELNIDLKD